ncbi:MAG: PLP-dependent aminotransferase family protein [Rhodospirillales bacterium]
MPRRSVESLIALDIDQSAADPLHRQVYAGIRDAILSGRLAPGGLLPSTRTLARDLALSRNTVMTAYELLASEGYTESRGGSATRVSSVLPDDLLNAEPLPESAGHESKLPPISDLAERMGPMDRERFNRQPLPFLPGVPDLDSFPFKLWARLIARFWRHPPAELLIGGDPAGYLPLRRAIADYLKAVRALDCDAGQVIITTGAQQALALAVRAILNPGDEIWVENPGYPGFRQALSSIGARPVSVAVDDEGLSVDDGRRTAPDARAAIVTPSHHYPLGITMSLSRRLTLLDWAGENNAWIIEDDYDSEFRYGGRPLSALQGLDRGERVVYVGTLSKITMPALRIGYLVVPPRLVDPILTLRRSIDDFPSIALQPALAAFIEEGHFAGHVRRMRQTYAERRDAMNVALERHLGGLFKDAPLDAGLHVCVRLSDRLLARMDDRTAQQRATEQGVACSTLSAFCYPPAADQGLVLGYAGYTPGAINHAAAKLAAALDD